MVLRFAIVIVFAMFGCTQLERDNIHDPESISYVDNGNGSSLFDGSSSSFHSSNSFGSSSSFHFQSSSSFNGNYSSTSQSSSSLNATCTANDNTETQYCSNGIMKDYGFLYDSRDGKTYKTVIIGTQTWMAENLNNDTYNNVEPYVSYDGCGKLYDWEISMNICPSGWHLPSDAEWTILMNYIGNNTTQKLLANNTDDYGFSALLCGSYVFTTHVFTSNYFVYVGDGTSAYFWTSSIYNASSTDIAWYRELDGFLGIVVRKGFDHKSYLSVRCIKD